MARSPSPTTCSVPGTRETSKASLVMRTEPGSSSTRSTSCTPDPAASAGFVAGTGPPRGRALSAVRCHDHATGQALLVQVGYDGEMVGGPDPAHRSVAGQPDRLHPATALPGQAHQDVVDPRVRDQAVVLVGVAQIPGEAGVARIGITPGVQEYQAG